MKHLFSWTLLLWCLLDHGVSGVDRDDMSVMEGDSVTLYTDVQTNQQEKFKWYFNDTRIAEINGERSKICTDDQCKERFRDRLKLDHQTGSLTITNTRTTDSGVYKLKIFSSDSERIFIVTVHGVFSADKDGLSVSVMEGDSVAFQTGVKTNQQYRIRWYYNDTRIAQINGDLSKICTDVQCNEGTERFRDRLKLDHQTGSLTITNITDTDSGDYQLKINSRSSDREKIFSVSVRGVSAANRDEVKRKSVMEGESVTLDSAVIKNPNYLVTWYFNDTLIAEITGDQSQICTDDQCKERFRDRLKLDHQTGSLIITNTTNTDSGDYFRKITNSRISIIRSFSVSVTAVPGSGLSSAAVAGICVGVVLLVVVVVAVIYHKSKKGIWTRWLSFKQETGHNGYQDNPVSEEMVAFRQTTLEGVPDGTCQTETTLEDVPNGTCQTETTLEDVPNVMSTR